MTVSERCILALILLGVISPLQFHLDWIDPVRSGTPLVTVFIDVLNSGPLYYFSVPTGIVLLVSIWRDRELREQFGPSVRLLSYACLFPLLAFVIEVGRVRYGASAPDLFFRVLQAIAAMMVLSVGIYSESLWGRGGGKDAARSN